MALRITTQTLWRAAPGFLVLSTVGGHLLEVDGPAAEFWQLLTATSDLDAIVEQLSTRYDVDPATVHRDLEPLVDALVADGFVTRDG